MFEPFVRTLPFVLIHILLCCSDGLDAEFGSALWWPHLVKACFLTARFIFSSKLPRPVPWNKISDVHRGSTLITWRWRYITWRWRHSNHANTITRVIAAKQTVINEVYVFSMKYRYSDSDILLKKNNNFIYSVYRTFWVIKNDWIQMLKYYLPYTSSG